MAIRTFRRLFLLLGVAFFAALLARPASAVQRVEFNEGPQRYAVPNDADFLAAGDFNGDGTVDIAVFADRLTNPIEIFYNDGSGRFPHRTTILSDFTRPVFSGDLNGDGIDDLIFPPGVVLLGSSSNSMQFAPGGLPGTSRGDGYGDIVAIGDFNGDGRLDYTINEPPQVWVGHGDGTFTLHATLDNAAGLAGDFNGDGRTDLQILSTGVLVLFGAGGEIQTVTNGITGWCAAAGDLNRDGRLDIVASRSSWSVFLGDGSGTFSLLTNYSPGLCMFDGFSLVDFNSDGVLDISLFLNQDNQIPYLVYAGNGDGTFKPPLRPPLESGIRHTMNADFDRDGVLDTAVLVFAHSYDRGRRGLYVANGARREGARFNPGFGPLAVGDFNGDGIDDLYGIEYTFPEANNIAYLGATNRQFETVVQPRYFQFANGGVGSGDFNNDGRTDLIGVSSNRLICILGQSDGSFRLAGSQPHIRHHIYAIADYNRDGNLDILTGSAPVLVLLGNGDGTFRALVAMTNAVARLLSSGDFNRDRVPDVVWTFGTNEVFVALGRGDGTLGPPERYPIPANFVPSYAGLRTGDLDQDGWGDIVIVGERAIGVFWGSANNGFTFSTVHTFSGDELAYFEAVGPLDVADLNGDGRRDLLVQAYYVSSMKGRSLALLNRGHRGFRRQWLSEPVWRFGDFDGDDLLDSFLWVARFNTTPVPPRTDLFWQHTSGSIGDWFLRGTNFIRSSLVPRSQRPLAGWNAVTACDFDRDGHMDLLWQHDDGRLAVWIMQGTNVLQSLPLRSGLPPSSGWRLVTAADFGQSSASDLLWQHADGRLAVWFMNGAQFITSTALPTVNRSWRAFGARDFNGDAHTDILFQNTSKNLVLWFMNGPNVVTRTSVRGGYTPEADWHPGALHDFNNDGKADIVWRHSDGRSAVWLMNGAGFIKAVPLLDGRSTPSEWQLLGPR